MKIILFVSLFFLAGSLQAQESQQPHTINQIRSIDVKVNFQYLLHLPEDRRHAQDGRLPMIVFLHGAGERGNDIELVKVHGPPKLISQGQDLPFIVLSPQCPANERWEAHSLKLLIDEIAKRHPVDTDRIYLTGLSMGGYGSWDLSIAYPEAFAAIAPICGGSDVNAWDAPGSIRDMPVWAFHGAMDAVVPVEKTVNIIRSLRRAGSDAKLTIYPDAGHDSWTETYDNPKLYEWFLQHSNKE